MRRPAKSAVNFEALDFIEITDTKVPRQPLIELPVHNAPLNLDYQPQLTENQPPTDSDNLELLTFEPSPPPADNLPTQEHLAFPKGNRIRSRKLLNIICRKLWTQQFSRQPMESYLVNHLFQKRSTGYHGDWSWEIALLSGTVLKSTTRSVILD